MPSAPDPRPPPPAALLPLRPQIAELLSQLPADMDVEGLVRTAVVEDEGEAPLGGWGFRGSGWGGVGRGQWEFWSLERAWRESHLHTPLSRPPPPTAADP
jgi:hypothetical protein